MLPTTLACTLLMMTMTLGVGCDDVKTSDRNLRSVGESYVLQAMEEPQTVLVDVRTADRYAAGHLPSAINIPLPDIRPRDPQLAQAQQIIVYAGGWTDPLSSAAAKRFTAVGYANVADFRGGTQLWQDAGHELVQSAADEE
ncbi:MAG: rhodanese-like domain-containing protein [Phycisphaeraceae bacterium]